MDPRMNFPSREKMFCCWCKIFARPQLKQWWTITEQTFSAKILMWFSLSSHDDLILSWRIFSTRRQNFAYISTTSEALSYPGEYVIESHHRTTGPVKIRRKRTKWARKTNHLLFPPKVETKTPKSFCFFFSNSQNLTTKYWLISCKRLQFAKQMSLTMLPPPPPIPEMTKVQAQ